MLKRQFFHKLLSAIRLIAWHSIKMKKNVRLRIICTYIIYGYVFIKHPTLVGFHSRQRTESAIIYQQWKFIVWLQYIAHLAGPCPYSFYLSFFLLFKTNIPQHRPIIGPCAPLAQYRTGPCAPGVINGRLERSHSHHCCSSVPFRLSLLFSACFSVFCLLHSFAFDLQFSALTARCTFIVY